MLPLNSSLHSDVSKKNKNPTPKAVMCDECGSTQYPLWLPNQWAWTAKAIQL